MPAEGVAAVLPPQGPAGQRQQQQQGNGISFNRILLGGALYFAFNLGLGWFLQKDQRGIKVEDPNTGKQVLVPSNTGDIPAFLLRPKELNEGATRSLLPKMIAPIWAQDSQLDIVVTVSPSVNPAPIAQTPAEYIVLNEKNYRMGNSSDKRSVDGKFTVPTAVQHNATLWGHFFIGLAGSTLDPRDPTFSSDNAYHFTYPLTQYLPLKKVAKVRNLLASKEEEEAEPEIPEPKTPIISNHYHPNASFSFVPGIGVKALTDLHPAIKQFIRLETSGARDGTGQNGWYYPLLFVNTFWQLNKHMIPLNETVKELPFHIDLNSMAAWQFQIMSSIETNSKENARQAAFGNPVPGTGDGSEIEMVKEILIDNNPILLAITAIVTVAHVILETLAFGSDIAHYRKKKDNVGISVRSILANVFMQSVIFLYLLDNSQNTSWVILGSQVVGIVIEFWKITTVVNVRWRARPAGSLVPYWFVFEDKHKLTETEEKTKEYDEIAFKYMYMVAVPLLIAYGIYSLIYETHKSWYSFIITTLVGSVYTYGFLMMLPSLYINYRLKSVAHMPAKAMMYKFLNTFIDDLFAFTIKMPWLHRLATLRDDVIFFIYLYQKWNYKTDYTRVNEFGQGGEDEDEVVVESKPKGTESDEDKQKKLRFAAEVRNKLLEEKAKSKGKSSGADTGAATKRK